MSDLTIRDYEEAFEDHRRLVHALDVIINGKEGAAPQARLCDLVSQLKGRNRLAKYDGPPHFMDANQCMLALAERLTKKYGATITGMLLFYDGDPRQPVTPINSTITYNTDQWVDLETLCEDIVVGGLALKILDHTMNVPATVDACGTDTTLGLEFFRVLKEKPTCQRQK